VIVVDKLIVNQQAQPQIYHSVHQMAQADVIRINFLHGDLGQYLMKICKNVWWPVLRSTVYY